MATIVLCFEATARYAFGTMIRANLFPITTIVLITSVPAIWLACGGGSKPPETPASETASGGSAESASSDTAESSSAAPAGSASAPADTPAAAAPTSEPASTAASTPPPASFDKTDCGKCIDKTCAKQAAACGKDNDCQATLDTIHNCTSGGAGCVESASAPSAAKAKKLAAAYQACGKKAAGKGGACKAKCQ